MKLETGVEDANHSTDHDALWALMDQSGEQIFPHYGAVMNSKLRQVL